jgi:hypothetical protein
VDAGPPGGMAMNILGVDVLLDVAGLSRPRSFLCPNLSVVSVVFVMYNVCRQALIRYVKSGSRSRDIRLGRFGRLDRAALRQLDLPEAPPSEGIVGLLTKSP